MWSYWINNVKPLVHNILLFNDGTSSHQNNVAWFAHIILVVLLPYPINHYTERKRERVMKQSSSHNNFTCPQTDSCHIYDQ